MKDASKDGKIRDKIGNIIGKLDADGFLFFILFYLYMTFDPSIGNP